MAAMGAVMMGASTANAGVDFGKRGEANLVMATSHSIPVMDRCREQREKLLEKTPSAGSTAGFRLGFRGQSS